MHRLRPVHTPMHQYILCGVGDGFVNKENGVEELKKLIEAVESAKIDLEGKQDELSKAELAFTTALEEVIEKCNELMDF